MEGIYRKNGQHAKVTELLKDFYKGCFWSCFNLFTCMSHLENLRNNSGIFLCRPLSCSLDARHDQRRAWRLHHAQALPAQPRRAAHDAGPTRALGLRGRHAQPHRSSASLRWQPAAATQSQLRHSQETRVASSQVSHHTLLSCVVTSGVTSPRMLLNFYRVASLQSQNKMSATNLASIFGPISLTVDKVQLQYIRIEK